MSFLVCSDDVNLLGQNINDVKKGCRKETGLEINAWKSKFCSKHGNELSDSIKGREFPSLSE